MAQFLSSVIYYSTLTRTKKYFCATRKHTEGTFFKTPLPQSLWAMVKADLAFYRLQDGIFLTCSYQILEINKNHVIVSLQTTVVTV